MEELAEKANHKWGFISSTVCSSQFVKQLVYFYHHIINLATDDKHNKDYYFFIFIWKDVWHRVNSFLSHALDIYNLYPH